MEVNLESRSVSINLFSLAQASSTTVKENRNYKEPLQPLGVLLPMN